MNNHLLKAEVQQFINEHLSADIPSLVLKKQLFDNVSNAELAQQIEAKKRSKKKLPSWFAKNQIYYPEKLNIEQSSSEITAKYKAHLVDGDSLIDLTGGFGVDSYYFSKTCDRVYHCERNEKLSTIASHNFQVLDAKNIRCIVGDGLEYLNNSDRTFDWIYVDPSRRDDLKGKVFHLSDCQPNVVEHLDLFFETSSKVLIKTSPMLDITKAIEELKYVSEVHVVSVRNEVKELLFKLEKHFQEEPLINVIELGHLNHPEFRFHISEEKNAVLNTGEPQSYLYEPNAAILKAGAFKLIAHRHDITKLHQHSHLYTSNKKIDFPGRMFKILEVVHYRKIEAKKLLNKQKGNITTRNFPMSVPEIKKLFKMKDGGETYYFFTTNCTNEHIIIKSEKV